MNRRIKNRWGTDEQGTRNGEGKGKYKLRIMNYELNEKQPIQVCLYGHRGQFAVKQPIRLF